MLSLDQRTFSKFRRPFVLLACLLCWLAHFIQRFTLPSNGFEYTLFYTPPILLLSIPLSLLPFCAGKGRNTERWSVILTTSAILGVFSEPQLRIPKTNEDSTLRIVSANLQSWEEGLESRLEALRDTDADVILMQELWSHEHLDLAQATLPRYVVRGDTTYFSGTAIASRLPLGQSPWVPPNRTAVAVLEASGRKIFLVSIQGDKANAISPAGLSRTLKLQETQIENLSKLIDRSGSPFIIGGDLNATSGAPLTRYLDSVALDGFQSVGTGYGYTFPSYLPICRLDRIFYSADCGNPVSSSTLNIGSDHLAVTLDLHLEPAAPNTTEGSKPPTPLEHPQQNLYRKILCGKYWQTSKAPAQNQVDFRRPCY